MTQLIIRPIADGDEEQVVALWHRCGLTRPWNDPKNDLAFARGGEHSDVLVGVLDSAIVASSMVGHDGHRGTLYYVAVDPDLHGRGHGQAIMQAGEDWLLQKGIWKVNLMIRTDNEKVLQFYNRLGYQQSATTVVEKWIDPQKRGRN